MKSTALIASVCLVLGIAIGWLSKPDPVEVAVIAGESKTRASSTKALNPTGNRGPSTVPSKAIRPADDQAAGKPSITMGGPNPAMQERFQKMILEQAKQKISSKVDMLSGQLGLSNEQTAQLQAYFDGKLAGITADGGMPDMMALSRIQSDSNTDTALADILTDEQSTAYEGLKTKERDRKVESRAYKDLARVNSVLDLDDEQKNAVYNILYDEAGRKVDQSNNTGSAMAMVMNGHGIDIELDDIGLGGIIESTNSLEDTDDPAPKSRENLVKRLREQNQKRINDQVERLAPALTPEQTEQYRNHLESKKSGMFQNMILEGDGDAPTGVFKIETSITE